MIKICTMEKLMVADNLLGLGSYTPIMASRFTGASVSKTNRLLFGNQRYERVWEPEIAIDGEKILSFKDLMEIKAIQILSKCMSLQEIRKARKILVHRLNTDYPFSSRKFYTDGKKFLLKENCEDIFTNQYNNKNLIEQSLQNIEFGEDSEPTKWWIMGKNKGILLDPMRYFGQPIMAEFGITTKALYERNVFSKNFRDTANYFCIPDNVVEDACEFESRLLRQNASFN